MERGAFCHDRCVCLLLADYVQDVDATKPNAEKAIALALYLSAGFVRLLVTED